MIAPRMNEDKSTKLNESTIRYMPDPTTTNDAPQNESIKSSFFKSYEVEPIHILKRVLDSIDVRKGIKYFKSSPDNLIAPSTLDIYGPIWISATLAFLTTMCYTLKSDKVGNATIVREPLSPLIVSGIIYYSYIFIGSLIIYCLCRFLFSRRSTNPISYLQLIGYYGYSLSLFIPTVIFLMIPWGGFSWFIVLLEIAFTGFMLNFNLQSYVEVANKNSLFLLIIIFAMHSIVPLIIRGKYLK
ncbi:hypothetical protein HZS_390 [Henneguya salminicola]|nr:hypothetical protein HZS_390 [Henneguya salminicola]